MAGDATDGLVLAMVKRAFREPPDRDIRSYNLDRISSPGHFMAVGAAIEGNDSSGRCEAVGAAQEHAILKRCAGDMAFLKALHLSVHKGAEGALFCNAANFLAVLLILPREAPQECFHEFDIAVGQLQFRGFGIELE